MLHQRYGVNFIRRPLLITTLVLGCSLWLHPGFAVPVHKTGGTVSNPSFDAANSLAGHGRYKEACQKYKVALSIEPKNARVHHMYGRTLALQGLFNDAITQYKEAAKLHKGAANADLEYDLGVSYAASGDNAEGARHLKKAVTISPKYIAAYNNLGVTLTRLGDYEAAKDAFEISLRMQPTNKQIEVKLKALSGKLDQSKHFDYNGSDGETTAVKPGGSAAAEKGAESLDASGKPQEAAASGGGSQTTAVAPAKPGGENSASASPQNPVTRPPSSGNAGATAGGANPAARTLPIVKTEPGGVVTSVKRSAGDGSSGSNAQTKNHSVGSGITPITAVHKKPVRSTPTGETGNQATLQPPVSVAAPDSVSTPSNGNAAIPANISGITTSLDSIGGVTKTGTPAAPPAVSGTPASGRASASASTAASAATAPAASSVTSAGTTAATGTPSPAVSDSSSSSAGTNANTGSGSPVQSSTGDPAQTGGGSSVSATPAAGSPVSPTASGSTPIPSSTSGSSPGSAAPSVSGSDATPPAGTTGSTNSSDVSSPSNGAGSTPNVTTK